MSGLAGLASLLELRTAVRELLPGDKTRPGFLCLSELEGISAGAGLVQTWERAEHPSLT